MNQQLRLNFLYSFQKASEDLLERETKRLAAEKVTCSLKTLGMKSMNNYRINKQVSQGYELFFNLTCINKLSCYIFSVLICHPNYKQTINLNFFICPCFFVYFSCTFLPKSFKIPYV